jgi:hypothetical protein
VTGTIGEIAPDLSRAVGMVLPSACLNTSAVVLERFSIDAGPTERLKSGAELRLGVVHPRRAEIFALPAWNQTIEDEDDDENEDD